MTTAMTPRSGLPILAVLTTVLVALIVGASGGLGLASWITTKDRLEVSWERLADGLADTTVQEVALFLSSAVPSTHLAEAALEQGVLEPDGNPDALVAWLHHQLRSQPDLTWLGWADADGRFLAANRWPEGGEVRLRTTTRVPGTGGTRHLDHQLDQGRWTLIADEITEYDPRVRPFYEAVHGGSDGAWIDPYLFASRQQPGVSYALPSRDSDGQLRGVWVADFECGPLSAFLGGLKVGQTGRVYLVDPSGHVVGHPDGTVARDGAILLAGSHPDPWLAGAWQRLEGRGFVEGTFSSGAHLASAHRFPEADGVPWWVLVVVPRHELYGAAAAQAQSHAVLTLLVVAIALVVALWFSRALSGAVGRVETQMARAARFELHHAELDQGHSVFRELNRLAVAQERMTTGLRSFGRYVPRKLVQRLLVSGDEAQLSGEARVVTVMFCEIEGFDEAVESVDASVLFDALSVYLSKVHGCIDSEQGTISQFLGDATMAFWGAPDDQPDHALRACRAAWSMSAAIDHQDGPVPLPSVIGVNTGTCLVGNIGGRDRFHFNILGDPVNTAARIKGINKVYGTRVLIGESTAKLVADVLLVRPVDWVRMKGKTHPVLVHELLGERAGASAALVAEAGRFGEALRNYRNGAFEEAAKGFGATRWAEPLRSRAAAFAADPPGPDWDGAATMRTK